MYVLFLIWTSTGALESLQRFPKSRGSSRTDKYCTSIIIANEDSTSGKFCVKYYRKHYGHEKGMKYLLVEKQDKEIIASKLILDISASKILNIARETTGNTINRTTIITRKDI